MSSPYASTVPLHSGSAITLLILSIALTFLGCGLGIPSLVMSIIALSKGSRDGASANRTVRAGWITFAVLAVLAGLFWVVVLVSGLSAG
jgi:Na+-driven multidrug efflux pump